MICWILSVGAMKSSSGALQEVVLDALGAMTSRRLLQARLLGRHARRSASAMRRDLAGVLPELLLDVGLVGVGLLHREVRAR